MKSSWNHSCVQIHSTCYEWVNKYQILSKLKAQLKFNVMLCEKGKMSRFTPIPQMVV